MTHPSRTERRTSKIRRLSDGLVMERHGPDAHGMVDSGEFEFVPADTPSVVEIVRAMGVQRLQGMLHPGAGTDREYLVRTVVARIEAGELPLPE